ncbi:hypothetical protein HPB50_008618 [Hyalomma asiaticum]|uniref:Uncharacterized protein n=1 Tax=Hyalomma asiaticum TaxID=266040 RepID=A0ACB7S256_HYAAI|nr:hypothetical protein HPB50_008618 [Hyalomma asiaticum]
MNPSRCPERRLPLLLLPYAFVVVCLLFFQGCLLVSAQDAVDTVSSEETNQEITPATFCGNSVEVASAEAPNFFLRTTPCVNGACDQLGRCLCKPCWEGDSCDEFVDLYPPSFPSRTEVVGISEPEVSRPVFRAAAKDRDLEDTCEGREPCACAVNSYAIVAGNRYQLFAVDNVTGQVTLEDPHHLVEGVPFPVTFGAWSPGSLENDTDPDTTMQVTFYLDTAEDHEEHSHALSGDIDGASHRHNRTKREAPPSSTDSENYRTDFKLNIVSGDPASMELGRVLEYELQITVPPTERLDLLIDIFTKDVIAENYVPPLAIFDVKTDLPPEMTFSVGEPEPKMILSDSIKNVYDRVVIEFGNIANPDTSRNILVRFSVTAVRARMTSKTHYVTVGAEFDFETYVWVGQTEVTVNPPKANEDEKKLEVDVSGPSEIALDSAGIYTVDMYLKVRSDRVTISVTGPTDLEDLLAVGNLGVSSFSENYRAVPNDVNHYKTVLTPSATKETYSAASIDMGLITSTGSIYQKARIDDNKISFTFALFALNKPEYVGETKTVMLEITVANKVMYKEPIYVNLTDINLDEPTNNIEDVLPVTELTRTTLGSLLKLTLHLNVTSGGFTAIRVMSEVDPESPMQLCSARFDLEESGFNLPWVNTSSAEATLENDHYVVDLGRVFVSQQRTVSSARENTLVLEVFVYVDYTMDVNLKEGNLYPIKMKVGKGDDGLLVPFEAVTLEPKRYMYNPDVKVFDAVGWRELYVSGAVALDVVISMPAGATHANITVDVAGQNNPSLPGLHVCRARLSFVGRALPCLQAIRDTINVEGVSYPKINPARSDTDSGQVSLGTVSHIPKGLSNITESKMIINFVATIQDDAEFANGAQYGIITTMSIGSKSVFVEEKKFVATRGPSKDLLKNNPIFAYTRPLWTSPIVPGMVAEFELVLKAPPRSMGLYLVEVSTASTDVSVCVLKIKSVGDTMPCLNADTPATYVLHDDPNDGNKRASIALQALANVGTYPMRTVKDLDPNTVVFSVMIRVKETATKNKALKCRISYGSKGNFEESLIVPVASGAAARAPQHDETLAKPPRQMMIGPHEPTLHSLAPGAMLLMTLFLELEPFTASTLNFDLTLDEGAASMDDFELCHEGISHLGMNYPCVKPSQWDKLPVNAAKRIFGHYDLHLICNSYIERKTEEENMLRFTVPLLLKRNSSLLPGMEVSMTATAVSGQSSRKTATTRLRITDVPDQTLGTCDSAFGFPSTSPWRGEPWPSCTYGIPLSSLVTRPQFACEPVPVEARGAVHEKSGIVNLHGLRVEAVGRNIPCWRSRPLNYTLTSSFASVQTDRASASLGFYSNPGYSHVRGKLQQGDDDIVVEVLAEMTDHPVADDGSRHPVTLQVSALHWRATATHMLRVVRTGKESALIDARVVVDDTRVYEREDRVSIAAYIRHSDDSTSEPSKLILRLFLPFFITFESLVEVVSVSHYQPIVRNTSTGVDIELPTLMFADQVEINMTLAVDPENKRGYGKGETLATIPYRVLCDQTSRGSQKHGQGLACANTSHLVFTVNSNECVFDLGLQSGLIENCQITASSAADTLHAPWEVRKGGSSVWSPAVKSSLQHDYLQVNFMRVTRVSQVEVVYVPGSRRVSKYSLLYSDNGQDWYKHGGLELYGCYIEEANHEDGAACEEDNTWYSHVKTKKTRHFAVDTINNIVYFCDFHGKTDHLACFSSNDGGKTWIILEPFVNYLLGFDPESSRMLACDSSGESFLASSDGTHWALVPSRAANASLSRANFVPSLIVPALTRSDILSKDLIIGDWKATYDGLVYKDAEAPAAIWKGCCIGAE